MDAARVAPGARAAAWRPAPRPTARPAPEPLERAQPAHLVVLLPLGLVAQHGVRLGDLLEALRSLRVTLIAVRVKFLRQLAVLLLDLILRRRRRHAKHGVVILALGHARRSEERRVGKECR